jgi:zinc protease
VPNVAAFHVAGAVRFDEVAESLSGITERWEPGEVSFPDPPVWDGARAGLYIVDVPGAAQSRLMIGKLALPATDPDFYPANVMNYRLGGGGFASDLMQVLREGKGYTYGIGSAFIGSDFPGQFFIISGVRSNVTLESLELIKEIVERHGPEFDDEDLAVTQGFLIKSNAGAFETLGAKLGILSDMSAYGFDADYVLQRQAIVREMTVGRIQELAEMYLDPTQMVWLVVGDAETQLDRLTALGIGDPIVVDRQGERVQ